MLVSSPKLGTLKADKRLPGSSRDTGQDAAGAAMASGTPRKLGAASS